MKTLLQKITRAVQSWFEPVTITSASQYQSQCTRTAACDGNSLDRLLLKAMGDRSQVERLIAYELRRSPGLARMEAIRRADERWERDLMS